MANDKKPESTKPAAASLLFQVMGNVAYNRDGVAKDWRDGDYLSFTPEDFAALPAALKERLKALDEVQIRKG